MDQKIIFRLLSEKGIDNVNLDMINQEEREKIYETYGDKFSEFTGPLFLPITIKAYSKASNSEKLKSKLRREADNAMKEGFYNYALLCYRLLKDDAMVVYIDQNFFDKGKDYRINYNNLFLELIKFC